MREFRLFGALSTALCVLLGCTSSSAVRINSNAEIKSYENIVLVTPRTDPRNVVPIVKERFEKLGYKVFPVPGNLPVDGIQGTGFAISDSGFVLTAAHVIGDNTDVQVSQGELVAAATVVAKDNELDIALLKIDEESPLSSLPALKLQTSTDVHLGDEIATLGFPLSSILGGSVRLSTGAVNALAGIDDDKRHVQISAPIQAGNSGGPLLNKQGEVIGVVTHSLNSAQLLRQSGFVPQNVNFAIRADQFTDFLQVNSINVAEVPPDSPMGFDSAAKSVLKIRSGGYPVELIGKSKVAVKLQYRSVWDIWYRFDYFLISFYDLDTERTLFVVGQDRNNILTTEDAVIDAAFSDLQTVLGKAKNESGT